MAKEPITTEAALEKIVARLEEIEERNNPQITAPRPRPKVKADITDGPKGKKLNKNRERLYETDEGDHVKVEVTMLDDDDDLLRGEIRVAVRAVEVDPDTLEETPVMVDEGFTVRVEDGPLDLNAVVEQVRLDRVEQVRRRCDAKRKLKAVTGVAVQKVKKA